MACVCIVLLGSFVGCNSKNSAKVSGPSSEGLTENVDAEKTGVEGTVMKQESEEKVEETKGQETVQEDAEYVEQTYTRVSVHDPSVVYDQGMYYIFGSHMAWAKSKDLCNWETFTMNINQEYNDLFGQQWKDYCYTQNNPNLNGNLWAPDVIYNKAMKKYCMYMSVNGSDYNSVIVLLTADQIEGPYETAGSVVYSGFNTSTHPVERTDVYKVLGEGADLNRYQSTSNTKLNAIDPCVKYDSDGSLWMSFGSWFGGIYLLKLDETTGLRDYSATYETVPNESDAYYGYKLAGGYTVSGEGSYITQIGEYYYLFLSYGGLTAQGGYQMRVFRSDKINGPYVDEAGNSAVYEKNENNLFSTRGVRLMGSYDWTGEREIRVAQGHNSAVVTEDGSILLVYHTRFADGKNQIAEAHEVRVQQLFVNQDGWLVCAPYEYCNEKLPSEGYTMDEMAGDYEFILHKPNTYYQKIGSKESGIASVVNLTLQADGTVIGDLSGTWMVEEGTPNLSITLDGVGYRGLFLKMPSEQLFFHPEQRKEVMTFTALGNNITVWGSKK